MVSTYHVLFWKRDKKNQVQEKQTQAVSLKGGVQTSHGTVPLQQPPSISPDPTAKGPTEGPNSSVPKNVDVNSISEPTHEQQLAKKPKAADKPTDIKPGGKPSERPLIETADGEVKKRYSPLEVATAQRSAKIETEKKEFNDFLDDSNKVIFTAKTVFPFDFFPDSIVVDMNRVNVVNREFFVSARIHSINLSDVGDVYVDTGPFLSTIHIQDKSSAQKDLTIPYLKTNDATTLRRILQGLVMVKSEGIDIKDIPENELRTKIEQIGSIQAA